jgi:hypothetical protein
VNRTTGPSFFDRNFHYIECGEGAAAMCSITIIIAGVVAVIEARMIQLVERAATCGLTHVLAKSIVGPHEKFTRLRCIHGVRASPRIFVAVREQQSYSSEQRS